MKNSDCKQNKREGGEAVNKAPAGGTAYPRQEGYEKYKGGARAGSDEDILPGGTPKSRVSDPTVPNRAHTEMKNQ